jgi:hypothetical protein
VQNLILKQEIKEQHQYVTLVLKLKNLVKAVNHIFASRPISENCATFTRVCLKFSISIKSIEGCSWRVVKKMRHLLLIILAMSITEVFTS